jgi:hypothetical protein
VKWQKKVKLRREQFTFYVSLFTSSIQVFSRKKKQYFYACFLRKTFEILHCSKFFLNKKSKTMSYSTAKLTTVSECDSALTLANDRKQDLEIQQTLLGRDLSDQTKSAELATANLAIVNAQIAGQEIAIGQLTDGPAKTDLQNKLRRLNDRKDNLVERLGKGGIVAVLDTELEAELLKGQLTVLNDFIAAITTRKGAL